MPTPPRPAPAAAHLPEPAVAHLLQVQQSVPAQGCGLEQLHCNGGPGLRDPSPARVPPLASRGAPAGAPGRPGIPLGDLAGSAGTAAPGARPAGPPPAVAWALGPREGAQGPTCPLAPATGWHSSARLAKGPFVGAAWHGDTGAHSPAGQLARAAGAGGRGGAAGAAHAPRAPGIPRILLPRHLPQGPGNADLDADLDAEPARGSTPAPSLVAPLAGGRGSPSLRSAPREEGGPLPRGEAAGPGALSYKPASVGVSKGRRASCHLRDPQGGAPTGAEGGVRAGGPARASL